ncbi:MAG: DUF748 domain-containing protein [Alcanivoracaceae bacterium]|nr:DUF748 domain-containing protein [Alcanivoracaceae bacterium]
MGFVDSWRQRPRSHRIGIIVFLLYVVYGLVGYFALSPLLRSSIQSGLSEASGRDVDLERVVFNPLGLTLTLENFALRDADGTEFVAFDRLYTDFELSSLFRLSWHFDVLELDRPRINISQTGPRDFNFDDIVARALADSGEAPQTDEGAGIPAFSISELVLSAGDFRFRDMTRGEPQELVMDDLNFEILDFSTRSDGADGNNYSLAITSPEGGRFEWSGSMSVEPLILNGRLEMAGLELPPFADFYREKLRFDIPEGQLDIATNYSVDLSGEEVLVTLVDGSVRLRDFRVRQPGLEQDTLTLPELTIQGVALNSTEQALAIDSLTLREPALMARQTSAGIDLAGLFDPPADAGTVEADTGEADTVADSAAGAQEEAQDTVQEETSEPGPADAGTAPTDTPSQPVASAWQVALARMDLQQGRVTFREDNLREPAEVLITPINLVMENLLWGREGEFTYEGDATIAGQGALAYSGAGQLQPLRVDLTLTASDVGLLPLEPWLREQARLDLAGGQVSAEISATVKDEQGNIQVTGGGQVSGREISVLELDGAPLLQLQAFDLADISVDVAARELAVRRTDVSGLAIETVIDEQGRHVADRVVIPVAAPVKVGETPQWRIRLGDVRLKDSSLAMQDLSMSPDFSFGLYELNGRLRSVDTRSQSPSQLSLSASVDRYAPLRVDGALKLATEAPYGDLDISLENYEMTSLTPYTGLYVGHEVTSGQLGLSMRMTLEGMLLDSRTELRAQNFYLGEKVESEEAIKAPVKLGLAVLRNRDGLIQLPVKASGDLSDPSVSVRGIILKALGNILVKAATSPFSMLAAMAGGDDLDMVPFPAGAATPSDQGRSRLNALVKVLAERPTLQMQLAGTWTREDSEALARQDQVAALWGDDWDSLDTAVDSWNFRRKVRNAYRELTGEDAYALAQIADDADGEARDAYEREVARAAFKALVQRGADNMAGDRLQALAAQRSQAAKAWLVQEGGVDSGRLFLQSEALRDQAPVSGVQVGLAAQ